MKFCTDCKYCEQHTKDQYYCTRKISPVTGKKKYLDCDYERSYYNGSTYDECPAFCGIDAFYFEQKEPEQK